MGWQRRVGSDMEESAEIMLDKGLMFAGCWCETTQKYIVWHKEHVHWGARRPGESGCDDTHIFWGSDKFLQSLCLGRHESGPRSWGAQGDGGQGQQMLGATKGSDYSFKFERNGL